jgi:protoporphyrinogen oxidase
VQETRFLLIGAGVTGLSFAGALEDPSYLICEAEAEIGGYCRTVLQAGFVWDYSGHFFHFRHPDIERELTLAIGAERVRRVVKDSRIHYAGRLIDYPFQRNIHQLPEREFLECLSDLFRRPTGPITNFHEMLHAKFGRAITDKFLTPYNEKVYATDLARLDPDAMGRFFPYADAEDIVRGLAGQVDAGYNATFTYPEGGAIEYIRALARRVDAEKILLHEPLLEVDLRTKTARTSQRSIRFEYLVSSMPFPRLLELCRVPFDRAVYSHNKVLVFNLGFDAKGPRGTHWIYYPDRDISFYRVGFYDNIFDSPRMSLYVELGHASDAVLDAAAIQAAKQRVLSDLRRVGIVDGQELVAEHSVVLDPAYVHITRASVADVAQKKQLLSARGVYSAGRYGSWTYCSIEDNIVEARELAARFNTLRRLGLG